MWEAIGYLRGRIRCSVKEVSISEATTKETAQAILRDWYSQQYKNLIAYQ